MEQLFVQCVSWIVT